MSQTFEERLIARAAEAIARTMPRETDIPDADLHAQYRGMARAAVRATLAELRDVVVAHKIGERARERGAPR